MNSGSTATRARQLAGLLLGLLLMGASASPADAATITCEYSGTLRAEPGRDCSGLDGAQFHYVATVDANATRIYSDDSSFDWFGPFATSLTLTRPFESPQTFTSDNVI